MADLLRRYWVAAMILVAGAALILAVELATRDTGAVLWMGGVIGVGAGMAIAAAQRRAPERRTKPRRR